MNTTTNIPPEVNNFYDRNLLFRATPFLAYYPFAQIKDIPRKAGSQRIAFRRYSCLAAALTPLSEGITPVGSSLVSTLVYATVQPYGDFVTTTDVVDYSSQDPVLVETSAILGDQAGDTLDQLTRNVVVAGTNVYYGGGRTSRITVTSVDLMTGSLIKKIVRLLKTNKTRKITRMIKPGNGYDTSAVNSCYLGIVHPNVTYDLKALSGFTPVEKYANHMAILDGEIGKVDEVRFIETTNAKVFTGLGAGGVDVYGTLIFGTDAYGMSRISGEALKNIIKPLGSGGSSDPLDQRATSGWKATFVAKILNDDFLVRVETAVSA